MTMNASIGKYLVTATVPIILLSSCTYDYDQFSSVNAGSASGGSSSAIGQGGTNSNGESGGTFTADSNGGQSSLRGGGSSSADQGGTTNLAGTGGTAPDSIASSSTGGQLSSGGTSNIADTGGTAPLSGSGGQSPTGGSTAGPSSCGLSQTPCGSLCVDLSSNTNYCGQCNIDCTAGGLAFSCYSGTCGCTLPANCGSGSGVDCVNHLCTCSGSTCSVGQVCQKHGNTQNCAAP